MINLWRYLFAMALTSVGMIICLILGAITGNVLFRDIGLGCVIIGVGILLIMVFKMRSMFKGMGYSGYGDKTWRSYPRE